MTPVAENVPVVVNDVIMFPGASVASLGIKIRSLAKSTVKTPVVEKPTVNEPKSISPALTVNGNAARLVIAQPYNMSKISSKVVAVVGTLAASADVRLTSSFS